MSSSSSDSESDEFEPIRRIKINIRPKDELVAKKNAGANIDEIKASVEAWRPLGPPPHPSLTRRQSSMSSVSSLSLGINSQSGSTSTTTTASQGSNAYNQGYSRHSNMRSSPSCSSLVNEFNNRSSFSNFMSTTSRTSSPLTIMGGYHCDAVPIAIAIQESIELTVKGQKGPKLGETKFDTRVLGNIKVAFPNAFVQKCNNSSNNNNGIGGDNSTVLSPVLKLRMHSTENIIRYYASRLIKDLDLETNNHQQSVTTDLITDAFSKTARNDGNNTSQHNDLFPDLFDLDESPKKGAPSSSKVIEFDMVALTAHLRQMYESSPNSRYYNVDVLRYQIAPPQDFEKCPIQVCAYWKSEPKLTKLRIDFKHSNKCGLNLERLRDIKFTVDLTNFIPPGVDVNSLSPDSLSSIKLNNNNDSIAMDMNLNSSSSSSSSSTTSTMQSSTANYCPTPLNRTLFNNVQGTQPSSTLPMRSDINTLNNFQNQDNGFAKPILRPQPVINDNSPLMQVRLPPPPSRGNNTLHRSTNHANSASQALKSPPYASLINQLHEPTVFNNNVQGSMPGPRAGSCSTLQQVPTMTTNPLMPLVGNAKQQQSDNTINNLKPIAPAIACQTESNIMAAPYITYEPQAHWDSATKKLTWKFDNLLSYYKSDGYGSLLAKLDFRNHPGLWPEFLDLAEPSAVDVKFMVVDSTLSKVSMSIDTAGYRMSLLKKEIRSGRYKSEPFVF